MVHYEVIPGFGHGSFSVANDMSYFQRVIELVGAHKTNVGGNGMYVY